MRLPCQIPLGWPTFEDYSGIATMKTSQSILAKSGLTLIELLCIIAILAILAAMLIPPYLDRGGRPRTAMCLINQKQIVLGEWLWHEDNNGLWLWQVHATNTPTQNFATSHFQSLTNYLKNSAVFVCPSDLTRKQADSTANLTRTNLSYFINCSATANQSNSVLIGDRHLEIDKVSVSQGMIAFSTNQMIHWTKELHPVSNSPLGVIGFADGHAEVVKTKLLGKVFKKQQNLATNLLAIP